MHTHMLRDQLMSHMPIQACLYLTIISVHSIAFHGYSTLLFQEPLSTRCFTPCQVSRNNNYMWILPSRKLRLKEISAFL